jgi:hypothetical protein
MIPDIKNAIKSAIKKGKRILGFLSFITRDKQRLFGLT